MISHGECTVVVEDNVVHTFPSGGFNPEGILNIRKVILEKKPEQGKWILCEHPKDLAGVTPDALIELTNSYQLFAQIGCIAIVLEVVPTWGVTIERQLDNQLPIPYVWTPDKQQLEDVLSNLSEEC